MSSVDKQIAHGAIDDASVLRFGGDLSSELGLVQHTAATGGILTTGGKAHRLTPIQFELLRILWTQARQDMPKPEAVRGFVSSYELLCSLPWEACHPEEDHLKQLVRRLRRRFGCHGVRLESCQGLGYRLKLVDSALSLLPARE